MHCLDKFNKKMKINGMSLREEHIFNNRMLLKETFADDASYTLGVYFWKLGLKEYKYESPIDIRLYGKTFSSANGVTVKFQTLHDTPVLVGDIIYLSKDDEYMICTESFDIDGINFKGKFTLCNWVLKWQNKQGKILEYPCYDQNTTQYNSGERSNSHFTIETSQHMITLPSDKNTLSLDTPQRFYLDKRHDNPTSFIVTQNDNTSHNYGKKGLVKLTLYASPNNSERDRPDLGICDYFEPNEVKQEPYLASNAVIEYDTNVIKSGGDSQVFIGKFYNEKGIEITDIVPHWTIICSFFERLNVKEFGNCLSIGINDDDYIDEEFKIICSDGNDKNMVRDDELIVKIESLL